MKKTYIYTTVIALALSFVACKSDNPDSPSSGGSSDDVEVTIATSSIETKASPMLEFKGNDKMNVFAKTYGETKAPNIKDNVVATFDGSKWTLEPAVYVNPNGTKNAFIYAVAPYDASYTDIGAIPVDMTKQVDLLYSGAWVVASVKTPSVQLKMKHALSLLTFNIVPVNYSGAGNVESLAVNGEQIYTTATLDASTGKVTNLGNAGKQLSINVGKQLDNGGWKSAIPGIWVLPFNNKGDVVTLTAVIDGKSYQTTLPELEVKTGWQYIMRLTLTNNGLEADPLKTETLSLNVGEDSAQNFEGYGLLVVTASADWMNVPTLTGDAVFGTLKTPSASSSYTSDVKVEGLKSGDKVIVESWNTSGFTLETLEGIGSIDLTDYE